MEKQYLDYKALEHFKEKLPLTGDYIEKVVALPTASEDELNKEYQYMGDDDQTEGLIHAHFYKCISDGESTPTYSWQDLGYQKIFVGHKADWELLTTAEKKQYDEAHFDDDDEGTDIDYAKIVPVGVILPYGASTAPSGWLLCQGQAVSRSTYADLFAAIGTSFGSGDGSTTFNLPDMREVVPVGGVNYIIKY